MRHKRISSRNTRYCVASCFLTFHCMASCQNVLVGVPCGPSSFNLANVECVAIGECSKKKTKITSCIGKSATSRHCTGQ